MTAAVTLPPANAALVSAGVQTIVTLPTKPKALTAGDRLVIHAGTRLPKHHDVRLGEWVACTASYVDGGPQLRRLGAIERDGNTLNWDHIIRLHPGHIVASAVVRDVVPIVQNSNDWEWGTQSHIDVMSGGAWLRQTDPELFGTVDTSIRDQLPLADFTPGRWAVLLDDVKPTTDRCPACWNAPSEVWNYEGKWCQECNSLGTCTPIPWKGKPGVWEVTW